MGDMTRAPGEVDRNARRGRAFGFRLISIAQRPARSNKDVLTQGSAERTRPIHQNPARTTPDCSLEQSVFEPSRPFDSAVVDRGLNPRGNELAALFGSGRVIRSRQHALR